MWRWDITADYAMKKLFTFMLLVFGALSVWADSFVKDNICYIIEDDIQVTATAIGTSPSGEVTIPEFITDNGTAYMVTKVDFFGVTDVTRLNLPRSIKEIGEQAFYGAEKLEYINWAQITALQTIGERAFVYSGLKEVTLPFNVRTVGENAFSGCEQLTTLTIQTMYLTELADNVFANCTNLKSLDLSTTHIQKIGNDAFYGCSALKTVKLPLLTLTEIGETAFAGCTSLTQFTIPNTVTKLGKQFLAWNTNLTTITTQSYSPCTATSDTFDGIDKNKVTLMVPVGAVAQYRRANGWKDFINITDGVQAVENVSADTQAPAKYMIDGNIYVRHAAKTYTLIGAEVNR